MFETMVAKRHIRSRKRQTALSILAIGLAVAISLTSVSLQNGFQDLLFDIIVKDLSHVSVTPKEKEDYIYLYRTLIDRIWSLEGVSAVSPFLGTSASLSHKDNVENVELIGAYPWEMGRIYPSIAQGMVQGDLLSIQQDNKIVIGKQLADKLEAKLGDRLEASFPNARPASLLITGIFEPPQGFPEGMTFVSLTTAQRFLGEGDVVNAIDIKLYDVYSADSIARELRKTGYRVDSWQQLYPEILRTLAIENFQNIIVMLLIMIIAAFGIASVMYMLVLEKTAEIGMLMATGASPGQIRTIFLIESAMLGFLGGLAGVLVGLVFSLWLKSLEIRMEAPGGQELTLPVIIRLSDILIILLTAVFLSVLAGAYPAKKASSLHPVEALHS